jgi:hypothetical protein
MSCLEVLFFLRELTSHVVCIHYLLCKNLLLVWIKRNLDCLSVALLNSIRLVRWGDFGMVNQI